MYRNSPPLCTIVLQIPSLMPLKMRKVQPRGATTKRGAYCTILGNLRMAEQLPDGHQDCRLTLHNGQYHIAVPFNAERRKSETQARVVALDPGMRTFLTWFSETDAGQIGKHDFGRIQRLCHHLDQLISRTAKAGARKRRNMRKAADRMRVRTTNLINELHHQAARFLVDNFDLILLPTFETSDMVQQGKRKIRSKSVRSMMTFAHYRFQQFLLWKAGETGKQVLLVNEAYTSKTCSWNGEIIWTLRISSGVSKGIDKSVVQSGRDFPYIRVGGGQ